MIIELQDFIISLKNTIRDYEFVQQDPRFDRTTHSRIGHRIWFSNADSDQDFMSTGKKVLSYIKGTKPIPKYREDWDRMEPYFNEVIEEYKRNPDSRRMVILNTENYLKVFPCFLSLQFIKDRDGSYGAVVYQRSQDIEKLHDDLVFFGYILRKFEEKTGKTVSKIAISYGHIHFTASKK